MGHKLKPKRKIVRMVKVSDNWFDNWPGNKAEMTYWPVDETLQIWGNDDFGMCKSNVSRKLFEKLSQRILNQDYLKSMGFEDI